MGKWSNVSINYHVEPRRTGRGVRGAVDPPIRADI